jgi:hypothetical protein
MWITASNWSGARARKLPLQVDELIDHFMLAGLTALLHMLLLGTPRPFAFFAWITALADVIAAAAPFTQPAPLASKIFTAIINIVVGVAVISLLSGVGRSAARPVDLSSPGRPMTARRDASI